jgi:alkanesulfonate monooxygenase SsuD/methylene tetrahydromethanopterin reductase-like flavin-dependent oxidoreductase (luciferase family)
MKFGLFYQAQLPKPLDHDEWYPDQEMKLFQDTLTEIEFADKLGFDYVWLAEHHFSSEYNHLSATDVMLGAVAARTQTIRLGPGIVQMMPGNNHPVKVAENIATIDLISRGRVEFGVGIGTPCEQEVFWPRMPEVVKAGKTYDVLWETVGETLRMMTMNPYPGFDGEYITLTPGNVVPKPVQRPHPPLWLAVTSERSLKVAAQHGMGALCLAETGPDEARGNVDAYWRYMSDHLAPVGQRINPVVCTFANAMVAATDEQARLNERGGADFTNYAIHRAHQLTRSTAHIHRELMEKARAFEMAGGDGAAEFGSNAQPMSRGGLSEHLRAGKHGTLPSSPDSPATIIGSPETARKRLMNFEASGIDVLAITQQVGTRRHEDIMESLERLGSLMPEFKERHERGRSARIERIEKLGFPSNSSI